MKKFFIFNEIELSDYLKEAEQQNTDILDFEETTTELIKTAIDGKHFPKRYRAIHGKEYEVDALKLKIPITGNSDILRCSPSRGILWTTEAYIEESFLCIEASNCESDLTKAQKEVDRITENIKTQLKYISEEIIKFNRGR